MSPLPVHIDEIMQSLHGCATAALPRCVPPAARNEPATSIHGKNGRRRAAHGIALYTAPHRRLSMR